MELCTQNWNKTSAHAQAHFKGDCPQNIAQSAQSADVISQQSKKPCTKVTKIKNSPKVNIKYQGAKRRGSVSPSPYI